MTKTNPAQTAQRIAALEAALAERDARIESLESRSSGTEAHRAVIYGFAQLAESRDDDTGEPLQRLRGLVSAIATEMVRQGLSHPNEPDPLTADQVDLMAETSQLHDIGKVSTPDAILLKPGRLTDEEWVQMRRHTMVGFDILNAMRQQWPEQDFLDVACRIALCHHENWDGGGYPLGLSGVAIPLCARIVSVADVYDALTHRRAYKEAMRHEDAVRIIVSESGRKFDPLVVQAFSAISEHFRDGGVSPLRLSA